MGKRSVKGLDIERLRLPLKKAIQCLTCRCVMIEKRIGGFRICRFCGTPHVTIPELKIATDDDIDRLLKTDHPAYCEVVDLLIYTGFRNNAKYLSN
jgi:hypothetical protein